MLGWEEFYRCFSGLTCFNMPPNAINIRAMCLNVFFMFMYFIALEPGFSSLHRFLLCRWPWPCSIHSSHTERTTFSHIRITLYLSSQPCKCHNNVSTVYCGMPGTQALPSPQAIFHCEWASSACLR